MAVRIARVIEVASWLTQLASYFGLPVAVFGGVVAGVFAWTRAVGPLVSILVMIFVITSVLQALMATTYLFDRLLESRRRTEEENAAIHYQLASVAAVMVRDDSNENAEFQVRVRLANTSSFPLRYLVISTRAVIDERVNPDAKPNYVPGVLPVGSATDVRFNSYARGRLPKEGLLRGRLELIYRYGHASKGFVFESQRTYNVRCSLTGAESKAARLPANMYPIELVVASEKDDPLSTG